MKRFAGTILMLTGILITSSSTAWASGATDQYEADKKAVQKDYDIVYKVAHADEQQFERQVNADLDDLAKLLAEDFQRLDEEHPPRLGMEIVRANYKDSINPEYTMGSLGSYANYYKLKRSSYLDHLSTGALKRSFPMGQYWSEVNPDSMSGAFYKYGKAVKQGDKDLAAIRTTTLDEIRETRETEYKKILAKRDEVVQEIIRDREKAISSIMKQRSSLYGEPALEIKPLTVDFDETKIMIDGELQYYDQPPVNEAGTILVPMRGIFEKLGASVEWNEREQSITGKKGGTEVVLKLGSKEATLNRTSHTLDTPVKLIGSTTMVPLRFIGEALGAKVEWDQLTQTAVIEIK